MNPARINMAIAEAVGWKNVHAFDRWKEGKFHADGCLVGDRGGLTKLAIPNYFACRNAIAEAVNGLNREQRYKFVNELVKVTSLRSDEWFPARIATATAEEYAIAFCKVKGLNYEDTY